MPQNAIFLSPYQRTSIDINEAVIKSSNCEKLLVITINIDFTLEEHINTLCRKAGQKTACLIQNFTIFITTQKADFIPNFFNFIV